MIMKLALAAFGLFILATPALAAGALPDGTYECWVDDGMGNGDMVIKGNTYQGPNYDGQYDGTYTFKVVSDNITWNGPLGLYSDGFDIIGSSVVNGNDNKPAIAINFRETGSEIVHTTYCDIVN
jgi:hypothetical protein